MSIQFTNGFSITPGGYTPSPLNIPSKLPLATPLNIDGPPTVNPLVTFTSPKEPLPKILILPVISAPVTTNCSMVTFTPSSFFHEGFTIVGIQC